MRYPTKIHGRTAAVLCLVAALVVSLANAERYSFFSGTVTEIQEKRVTVNRKGSEASADESRTFILTDSTKVEGDLRTGARVTVGYISGDHGDVASRIIVRSHNPKKN